jgi:hypothetical protein
MQNSAPELTIVYFKAWPKWISWLLHEPETRLYYSYDYAVEGGFYCWDGKLIGRPV